MGSYRRLGEILVAAALLSGACSSPAASTQQPVESGASGGASATPEAVKAAWIETPLTNAGSGEAFKISDFEGKVVLVEAMAVWCSSCQTQQENIHALYQEMGDQSADLVSVSLDIDAREDQEILRQHVESNGFDWYFAVAPPPLVETIGTTYGAAYLSPSATPILIVDRRGVAHPLIIGLKSANFLKQVLQPYLDDKS
jgi:cytochrome oxidase Cu insertion factor (SCO1/SenC/PrrC family)